MQTYTPIQGMIICADGTGDYVKREDFDQLKRELDEAESRLEGFHEVLQRKNTVIRMLAMGDCTAAELQLSDDAKVALLP